MGWLAAPTRRRYRAVVGLIVTITSIGSGSITLPLLTLALPGVGLARVGRSDIAYAAFPDSHRRSRPVDDGRREPALGRNLLLARCRVSTSAANFVGRMQTRLVAPAVALTLVFVATRLI